VSGQQHAPAALYPRERPGTHCTGGLKADLLTVITFLRLEWLGHVVRSEGERTVTELWKASGEGGENIRPNLRGWMVSN